MIKKADLEKRMVFYEKFPEEVIPNLQEIDFAFIDESPLFDYAMMDFILMDEKLRVGRLIGFHNLWMPSLKALLRYMLNNRSYRLVSEVKTLKRIRRRIKKAIRGYISKIPNLKWVFSGNFLQPFYSLEIGNLILLR